MPAVAPTQYLIDIYVARRTIFFSDSLCSLYNIYVKYRDALRGLASPKWLIVLPITWAYPIPIMAYTIIIHHEYFLRVLRGERIFNSYRFPGVMEGAMLTLFVGFFIAVIYTSVSIYMHYKLYKYYTETNRH